MIGLKGFKVRFKLIKISEKIKLDMLIYCIYISSILHALSKKGKKNFSHCF